MKTTLGISLAALFVGACSHESLAPTFDVEQNTGMWVLYEIVRADDGTTDNGPFPGWSVFGGYDSSVQLNDDGSYIPLTWYGPDDIQYDGSEGGTYEYLPDESKLVFTAAPSWKIEFEVTHSSGDELWLRSLGDVNLAGGVQALYKLRRETGN